MRAFTLGFAAIAGLMVVSAAGTATADPYKYCAFYSGGDDGGGTNCGFTTIEQCRATISGAGGSCGINLFYDGVSFDGPRSSHRPARRAHKRHPQG